MTDTIERIDDVFRRPAEEALPILRAQGLLPADPRETAWRPDGQLQPVVAPLATLSPRQTFTAGKAGLTAFSPQWLAPNSQPPEVSLRSQTGLFSVIYFDFQGLGANRKCVAWVDLRVYGPGATSLSMGATGNPATIVVNNSATGGQKVSVPLAMTATPDGRAYAYLVPTLTGHGGAWFGLSLYGL